MSSNPTNRQFETSLEIAAPRDLVWKALSQASELVRWFAGDARVEPGVGGSVHWIWPGLHDWKQTVEVWDEGRRLRTRYDSPVDDGHGGKVPLFMEFTLEGEGGTTNLRLVHSGFGPGAEFDGEFDGISQGWQFELRCLRLYLEQHAGEDRELINIMLPIDLDEDAAWQRLTGADGLACGADIDQLGAGADFSFAGFEGRAMHCHRHSFSGEIVNLGHARLRASVGSCGPNRMVTVEFGLYGQPPAVVEQMRAATNAMLEGLFGNAKAPA